MAKGVLSGQVAIVTGSAINTGSVIARTLARAGAAVVVNYRSSAEGAQATVRAIEADGGRAIAVQADVSDQVQVKHLFDEAVRAFGAPGILVNNANVRSYQPLLDITIEDFRRTVAPSRRTLGTRRTA